MRRWLCLAWPILSGLALPCVARAQAHTVPGVVTTPYPTIEHLSVEWAITGDDDRDGIVTVRFRAQGTSPWRQGLPLVRVPAGNNEGFSWGNKHSGSLFGLDGETTYEIELTLTDPDGGFATQIVVATTRAVPRAPDTAVVRAVTPSTFATAAASADPGDLLLLATGTYAGFTFPKDGTAALPIVVRAETPGGAVVNGDVRLDGRSHVFLEGLVVNGMIKFNGAEGIVVRGCTVQTTDSGIVSMGTGSSNAYIADNVVLGPSVFTNASVGADGDNLGEGIELTGPGNIIVHNFVKGFRDAISTLEDSAAVNQISIDILDNDIEIGADDAIEADFTMGNCRIMRNRIHNSFVGLSSQPGLGGPTYFVRNVMFNIVYSPFKLHRGSRGDIALHNTAVKCGDALAVYTSDPWDRAFFRNNLFVGGSGGGTYGGYANGDGRITDLDAAQAGCSFDYDGFGSIGTGAFQGNISGVIYTSLATLRSNTTEVHAQQIDLSVFAANVSFPSSGPFPEKPRADLRLVAVSPAVDTGVPLANINDGFAGTAPDLGAYEVGATLPAYGPRPGEHPGLPPPDDGAPTSDGATNDDGDSAGDGSLADAAPGGDAERPPAEGTVSTDADLPASDHEAPGLVAGGCSCREVWGSWVVALGLLRPRRHRCAPGKRQLAETP